MTPICQTGGGTQARPVVATREWAAGAFIASTTHAAACGICASTMSYDALRFTPAFFLLALLWAPVAIAADMQASRSGVESRRLAASMGKYLLLAVLLGGVFGLHVALIAWFPVYLWSRVFAKHTRRPLPQVWVRKTATVFLVIMGISIPLSYAFLPKTANEVTVRDRVSETKQKLRQLDEALRAETKPELLSALPGALAVDPFDYDLVSIPLFVPVTQWNLFIGADRVPSAPFGYATSGTAALIWSRGPDGDLDLRSPVAFSSLNVAPEHLTALTYDPTNGILSGGDILHVEHLSQD